MKPGSSAACRADRREVYESWRHDGHFEAMRLRKSREIQVNCFRWTTCRRKVLEALIFYSSKSTSPVSRSLCFSLHCGITSPSSVLPHKIIQTRFASQANSRGILSNVKQLEPNEHRTINTITTWWIYSINKTIMEDSSSMFYAGDLQSGIGQALQESKLVACFVTGIYHASYQPLLHPTNSFCDRWRRRKSAVGE